MSISDQYLTTFVVLGIAVFSNTIAKNYTSKLKPIFDNQIIKTIILFFIAYYASKNIFMSIILALSFVTFINVLTETEVSEAFQQTKQIKDIEHFTNTIERLKSDKSAKFAKSAKST